MILISIPDSVVRDRSLPAAARLLYGVIAGSATVDQGCRLTLSQLAERSGQGQAATHRNLDLLDKNGLIRVEKVHATSKVYWPLAKADVAVPA